MYSHKSKYYILVSIFITIFLFTALGFSGFAQEIKAKAVLEKNKILIGDQVKLNISVIKPKNTMVALPDFVQKINDTIEIIEQLKTDTSVLEDGTMLIEKNVIITAFDSGNYIISPIAVLIKENNSIDTVYTNALALTVNTVPLDTTNVIKDIKLPYAAPVTFREALPYILGIIATILIILVIIYIFLKIKRKEPIFKRFRPLEPAHIIAFRDLDKLKKEKLWQNERIKEYYTRLSDILRHYLWNRYAIRTMERTSEEILKSLKDSDFNDDKLINILKDIFVTSDLVKFAKFKPSIDEHDKCYNGAFTFVDNTKLIIIEDTEQTEGSDESVEENISIEDNIESNEKIDQ